MRSVIRSVCVHNKITRYHNKVLVSNIMMSAKIVNVPVFEKVNFEPKHTNRFLYVVSFSQMLRPFV